MANLQPPHIVGLQAVWCRAHDRAALRATSSIRHANADDDDDDDDTVCTRQSLFYYNKNYIK